MSNMIGAACRRPTPKSRCFLPTREDYRYRTTVSGRTIRSCPRPLTTSGCGTPYRWRWTLRPSADTYFKGHGQVGAARGAFLGDNILGGYVQPRSKSGPRRSSNTGTYDPEGAERAARRGGVSARRGRHRDSTLPMVLRRVPTTILGYYDIVIAYLGEVGIAARKDPMDHPSWIRLLGPGTRLGPGTYL